MIVIDILNPEEIARQHAGRFKVGAAKVLGIDLKKRIEKEMAERLAAEMQENGLDVNVWVDNPA